MIMVVLAQIPEIFPKLLSNFKSSVKGHGSPQLIDVQKLVSSS